MIGISEPILYLLDIILDAKTAGFQLAGLIEKQQEFLLRKLYSSFTYHIGDFEQMSENKMVVHISKKMGKILKEKREYLSMSLDEAAALTGITPGYLGLVERGCRNLKVVELDELLEILKIDMRTFA